MVKVNGSSTVEAIGYDIGAQCLHVKFKRSSTTYEYLGIPPSMHADLMAAPSKGRWIAQFLKGWTYCKLPSCETGGITWRADTLEVVLEDSLRLNVLQDEGCCGVAAAAVDLNRMRSFTCPTCGLDWEPEVVEEIRIWKSTPIAIIVG